MVWCGDMIIRAAALGFLLWIAEFAVLRFLGPQFFTPGLASHYLAFAASGLWAVVAAYAIMQVLREAHGDETEAAAAVALPGLALGAAAVNFYPVLFPALDPVLDGVLAVHILLQILAILGMGLFFTRLAPEDERI